LPYTLFERCAWPDRADAVLPPSVIVAAMKVLIITFAFPPANVIGAIRVGKLARYLDCRGHDVRVLTTNIVEDRSLPLEIAEDRVIYTDYRSRENWLDFLVRRFHGSLSNRPTVGNEAGPAQARPRSNPLRSFFRRQYYSLLRIPDMRSDWIKSAIPAGRRLIEEWRPDIILASAPPYTGLVIGSRLARVFGIPWVADFRDLWVDNPYYSEPAWRRAIDTVFERLTLRNAARLVTVSPIWAEQLRGRHGRAAEVVYNGYAQEDFPPILLGANRGETLTIRYMGSIYGGYRDPSPVFAAIALLPKPSRDRIVVEFFCDDGDTVLAAAAANDVTNSVTIKPRVPYQRALQLQMEADVLLLLQSTEQRDEGNLPGKLFEYLYARRPILFIGYEHGIAAQLVRDRGAGLVSNAPIQIRDQLRAWLADKQAGGLRTLDPSVCQGLSRDEQFRKLEHLFVDILNERRRLSEASWQRSDGEER
jgi:hypothetical protein